MGVWTWGRKGGLLPSFICVLLVNVLIFMVGILCPHVKVNVRGFDFDSLQQHLIVHLLHLGLCMLGLSIVLICYVVVVFVLYCWRGWRDYQRMWSWWYMSRCLIGTLVGRFWANWVEVLGRWWIGMGSMCLPKWFHGIWMFGVVVKWAPWEAVVDLA